MGAITVQQGGRHSDGLLAGVVVARQAGFYAVRLEDGREVSCVLRGKVRRGGQAVLVGDRVDVRLGPDAQGGVVESVAPRTTQLLRPPVANVTHVVVVLAVTHPDPDLLLTDRLLVSAQAAGVSAITVCINKLDLGTPEQLEPLATYYRRAGYPVLLTSARTGEGIAALRTRLAGHIATLAGPSGVGKSALLNRLCPGALADEGEVSHRSARGRHTTRMVRLRSLGDEGLLADTPGFSRLDVAAVQPRELARLMPDVLSAGDGCAFGSSCLHRAEPGCAVQMAVRDGRLLPQRYAHYLRFLEEAESLKERRYS